MFCDQAKEYLSQKGLKFEERDIAQDPGALADLKKLGYSVWVIQFLVCAAMFST